MKTWGEVKTAIEGKLYITSSDEAPEEYVNQYETLANEALSIIANGVKPMVKYYEIDVYKNKSECIAYASLTNSATTLNIRKTNGKILTVAFSISDTVARSYYDDLNKALVLELSNGNNVAISTKEMVTLYEASNGNILDDTEYTSNTVVKMPEDFLSFIGVKILKDGEPCKTCAYYATDGLLVKEAGHYVIPYYGMYPEILTANNQPDGYNNQDLGIPRQVLDCVPAYVASKCLQEDDLQRSTVLSNDFEMQLARLDDGEMYDVEHYESEGGWY